VKVALTVPTTTLILYPVASLPAGPNAAMGQRFVNFLQSAPAQGVLARHGFGKP